jgi:integrase/recombinase XerD
LGIERINCYNLFSVPVQPMALRSIGENLEMGKHGQGQGHGNLDEALFRPVPINRTGRFGKRVAPGSINCNIVMNYTRAMGITAEAVGVCVHSLRATAATNAL